MKSWVFLSLLHSNRYNRSSSMTVSKMEHICIKRSLHHTPIVIINFPFSFVVADYYVSLNCRLYFLPGFQSSLRIDALALPFKHPGKEKGISLTHPLPHIRSCVKWLIFFLTFGFLSQNTWCLKKKVSASTFGCITKHKIDFQRRTIPAMQLAAEDVQICICWYI